MSKSNIICFGETLWDVFPDEKRPGGAPMNVAVHLHKFGLTPKLISRVGNDELGRKLIGFLEEKGIDTQLLQTDDLHPTGVVNVQIADSGDAKYDIVFPSAWDFINSPEDEDMPAAEEQILVFGSLASRNKESRSTLINLLERTDLALFDVNLRAPHYSRSLIELLLGKSDIVKLNEHELQIIGSWLGMEDDSFESICHKIADVFSLPHIILTMGGEGALVVKDQVVSRQKGFKVKVKDTVGSGDSFLAAYLAHFVKGESVATCLKMACATGAFVASSHGAVPDYGIEEILRLAGS